MLIYATNKRGLLIFREPEFPEVPPQVPGGTIDGNENPAAAAKREFREETGLSTPERDGHPHQVNRYYYHTVVSDDLPNRWDHYEKVTHDSAKPILFRFSWVSLEQAPQTLGIGMEAAIPSLRALLAEMSQRTICPCPP